MFHSNLAKILSIVILLSLAPAVRAQHNDHHNDGHHEQARIVIANESHDRVNVTIYDEDHHRLGNWSIGDHARIALQISKGHYLTPEAHMEIEIQGQQKTLDAWARREGGDWVIYYTGNSHNGGHNDNGHNDNGHNNGHNSGSNNSGHKEG